MSSSADRWNRRRFLQGASLAGVYGVVGLRPERALAEPPPETNRIRLAQTPAMCEAPQYIVGDLLKAEGFTAVEYVRVDIANPNDARSLEQLFASGAIDIGFHFAAQLPIQLDLGDPVTALLAKGDPARARAGCRLLLHGRGLLGPGMDVAAARIRLCL